MSLSNKQVNEFHEKGFIAVPKLYSADDIQIISDWLDELRGSDGSENEIATYFEASPINGETVLVRAEYLLGKHNPVMTELFLKEETMAMLAQLLGDKALLFKEKANYKLPGCRSDLLHQDQAAGWGAYSDFFITMLIAIDENRIDNAAVSFRDADDHYLALRGPEWEVLSEEDPPFQPEDEYQVVEAAPGDVVFFDCYVPHGSPANTTNSARRNIYLTFNRAADGDQRMAYYEDKWKNYPSNTRSDARDRSTFKV
ncbi:MAG: phytanoyl-CoA dioxygenase family protein [Gammaproteobacteria bacterium]|nr:phytanoyl-CoA dioxygenase family protein [Gammaproteobacteria bacterium]MCP4090739.1 phytanoyl-CoA dioxygenase family protein [Gammaproteobacteria bacterium]MCP4277166.1 phytanoyl-CoA dioxygenase family protein [Gammaproteobacteria bacterium]MCP4831700.1 phytanoyl-CoA dioxygenase family protein [Gammaproteobacteria bacterium]MCP4928024.1 phytanoyl-CoA dioxygenase family protein [Gammaproteobacteria bacterium]